MRIQSIIKGRLTLSATNKWTFPECSMTSCFNLVEMSSLSISAASYSPSANSPMINQIILQGQYECEKYLNSL